MIKRGVERGTQLQSFEGTSLPRRPGANAPALPFRADIEGLRAVAILLVVAAHAKVPWLAGGFIGVDVFFVLSGFLITGLLLMEFEQNGNIRLSAFYARRLQRLFPALLVVVVATCLASGVLLAPHEQQQLGASALAAATWVSNFYFSFAQLDYFGARADANPFLHTWSLGVEEQFYLLWPTVLLFLLGAWGWQGRRFERDRLFRGLVAIFLAGFAFSVFLTYTAPRLGFYMVVSRAWQFALGALVLLASQRFGTRRPVAGWWGWLGLAGIVVSAMLLDAQKPYPGTWAMAPSLATALVLWSGSQPGDASTGASRLLSQPPMQAIGGLSYAWYLWHWPVLLLGASLFDASRPLTMAALVAASLALAWITRIAVEGPIRHSRELRSRPASVLLASAVAMLVVAVAVQWWQSAARGWSQATEQRRIAAIRGDVPRIYPMGCDEWYSTARVKTCWFGNENARKTAVLIGDSMVGQWFPALAPITEDPDWRLLVVTKSACAMVDAPFFYERIGRRYTECETWRRDAVAMLQELKPDLVVSGSSSSYPFSQQQWIEGSKRVFLLLASSAERVVILQSTPTLPFDAPACLAREGWRPDGVHRPAACSSSSQHDGKQAVRDAIQQAARGLPNVRVLDFSGDVCPNHRCSALLAGTPVFRDTQHLSGAFARRMAPRFLERVNHEP